METEIMQDQFGNRVEIHPYNDGSKEKTTFPTEKYFDFLGNTYAGFVFTRRYGAKEAHNVDVKVYYKDNDSEAALQRDYYGRLWLYFYDEYACPAATTATTICGYWLPTKPMPTNW